MAKIKVVHPSDKPVVTPILAEAIVQIGAAAEALRKSGLNEEAILILLAAKCGVGKGDCRKVILGLRQLRAWYVR